jgi:hypothetical protein
MSNTNNANIISDKPDKSADIGLIGRSDKLDKSEKFKRLKKEINRDL